MPEWLRSEPPVCSGGLVIRLRRKAEVVGARDTYFLELTTKRTCRARYFTFLLREALGRAGIHALLAADMFFNVLYIDKTQMLCYFLFSQ